MGLRSKTLSARHMARFCQSLSTLYNGGVPIARALTAIEESAGRSRIQQAARDLRGAVEQGATVTEAIREHHRYFPPIFIHMMAVAEQSGSFSVVLPLLLRYFEDVAGLYRAVIKQSAYPAAVLVAMMVGVPIVEAFLADVAGIADAPFGTQLVWILSNFAWKAGGLFFAVVVAARITLAITTRESVLMYCWPFSGIVRRLLIARFAWAMMVFTRTGSPLHHAVRLAGTVTGAGRIARDFGQVAPLLQQGHSLEQALAKSRFFPRSAMVYINTGEISGKLDECFEHLARGLYDESIFRLRILTGIIEPLAILGLGALAVATTGY